MRRRGDDRIRQEPDGRAVDPSSGASVERTARDRLTYDVHGRHLDLYLEADRRGMTVWFPSTPQWDDGTPLSAADTLSARDTIGAVARVWRTPVTFR